MTPKEDEITAKIGIRVKSYESNMYDRMIQGHLGGTISFLTGGDKWRSITTSILFLWPLEIESRKILNLHNEKVSQVLDWEQT